MYNFANKLNKNLNIQLQTIDLEETDLIKKAQKSIRCIKNTLIQLKAFILEYSFSDDEEEILFFKEIKPELFSKLIYFVKLFNIESLSRLDSSATNQHFYRIENGNLIDETLHFQKRKGIIALML